MVFDNTWDRGALLPVSLPHVLGSKYRGTLFSDIFFFLTLFQALEVGLVYCRTPAPDILCYFKLALSGKPKSGVSTRNCGSFLAIPPLTMK